MNTTDKDLHFKLMSLQYKIRDFFNPPVNILKSAGIKPGYYVLDFGCGPGGYSISASRLIGKNKVISYTTYNVLYFTD
jgi:23S rRNA U2552 (ribose-2'-O)-methylase RlmE/FtsJ